MTKDQLISAMRDSWTGNGSSGLLPAPEGSPVRAMLDAQLGAVADGIIAALSGGVSGYTPAWYHQQIGAGVAGSQFTLPHTPVSPAGLLVFLNGQVLEGWTLVGTTLTLLESKWASDVLFVHYQAVVPT